MENFPITAAEGWFDINGVPDAAVVVGLKDKRARRLADLFLHKDDLEFAAECLERIATKPERPDLDDFLKEALWRTAVIHFFKCFGDGARFRLARDAVYKTEPPEAKIVFDHMKDLRNKHFVHDENSYLQCRPTAVLNDGSKRYKVEKIVCVAIRSATLHQDSFTNLRLLVTKALEWVVAEFDSLADAITAELESLDYVTLAAMPAPQVTIPSHEEAGVTRKA
ncbi:hypothetical protein [Burkholderia sp. S-53]|uniref:hypothetical protein n=1 Tax=Burkholderia sp. S-53 TaxID=2906514 RepID=UPI0021D1F260|nr:hypothetical protein [Burkholderia sp. S-53]UXU86796.1 hypothetical protein LXM88_16685 [Burkholderia sp. S-53]